MRNVTPYDYEKAKYHSLFDLIKDQNNWKNPIDCWIPKYTFEDFNQAVTFFTAGPLRPTGEKNGSFIRCKVNGYYVDCGA